MSHTHESTSGIKTEATTVRRRTRGSRYAEDYLRKGGLMAFYNLSDFNIHFGMTRTRLQDFLTELMPHYQYERGSKLPLENVVLASLWVLCSQEPYRIIADRFQTSKSVICSSLHTFCNLVSEKLEKHIRWPVGNGIRQTARGFEGLGFPGTIGVMGAFLISISKPKDVLESDEFLKESNAYCTTLLAICDDKYKFTYVSVGHSGAFDKCDVFRSCEIFETIANEPNALFPNDFRIDGKVYPYHIVADSAFPLSEYVMTPFVDTDDLKVKEQKYNTQHSSILSSITKAVAILKARYNRLRFLQMQHLTQCNLAIKTCCILHNFCVQVDDVYNYKVDAVPPPTTVHHVNYECNLSGEKKRELIADALL